MLAKHTENPGHDYIKQTQTHYEMLGEDRLARYLETWERLY